MGFFEDKLQETVESGTSASSTNKGTSTGDKRKDRFPSSFSGGYYDNIGRFNKVLWFGKSVGISLLMSILAVVYYMYGSFYHKYYLKDFLIETWDSLVQFYSNLGIMIGKSYGNKVNEIIESNGWTNFFSFYPIKPELLTYYEVPTAAYIMVFMFVFAYMTFFQIKIIYGYFTQRIIYSAGITWFYVPFIFYYHFSKREKNKFFYVKQVPQQEIKDFYSQNSKRVIKNLFNDNELFKQLDSKDKVEVEMDRKSFLFGWFIYYKIYYTINAQEITKSSSQILEEKNNVDNEKEQRLTDLQESLENSSQKELNAVELEELEIIDID